MVDVVLAVSTGVCETSRAGSNPVVHPLAQAVLVGVIYKLQSSLEGQEQRAVVSSSRSNSSKTS